MSDVQTSADVARAAPPVRAAPRVSVRTATWADEPEIMRLLQSMHAEGGMPPLDEDCARATFAQAFNRKGGIIGVIGAPNDIRGMIYLMITRFWYRGEYHLEEIFNYVRPDCRKEGLASVLIGFAKDRSDQLKVPLCIGVLTNHRMAEKVRLYRRYLGPPSGAFFIYNATWANEAPENADIWKAILREGSRPMREIEPGARTISVKVLEKLGDGDVAAGRKVIDSFINTKIGNGRRNGAGAMP